MILQTGLPAAAAGSRPVASKDACRLPLSAGRPWLADKPSLCPSQTAASRPVSLHSSHLARRRRRAITAWAEGPGSTAEGGPQQEAWPSSPQEEDTADGQGGLPMRSRAPAAEVPSRANQQQQRGREGSSRAGPGREQGPGRRGSSLQAYGQQQLAQQQQQQVDEVPPDLHRAYPWLFSPKTEAAGLNQQQRIQYAKLLQSALPILATYDIASPSGRQPDLERNPRLIEPSLTAREAARREAEERTPRPRVAAELLQSLPLASSADAQGEAEALQALPGVQDDRWLRRLKSQEAYLVYMRELRAVLLPGPVTTPAALQPGATAAQAQRSQGQRKQGQQQEGQQQQQQQESSSESLDAQLSYQAGLCDDWLQLLHMQAVFGPHMGPAATAALHKRLPQVVGRKLARSWGPSERLAFRAFCASLAQQAARMSDMLSPAQLGVIAASTGMMQQLQGEQGLLDPLAASAGSAAGAAVQGPPSSNGSSSSTSVAAGADQAASGDESLQALRQLADALTARAISLLSSTGQGKRSKGAEGGPASSLTWEPADYAGLMWGLGLLGYKADPQLLQLVCRCSHLQLERCEPQHLWQLLWGAAQMGQQPRERWLQRWLGACERLMTDFDAEGLVQLVWSLAALRQVPHKEWLRRWAGALGQATRSLLGPQMVLLLEALAVLQYKPRDELCSGLISQLARHLHVLSGPQLALVLKSLAAHASWRPPDQFLYNYVAQAQPKLAALSPAQAAAVLWAFARFNLLPEPGFTSALALRVASGGFSGVEPDTLAMSLWALATLGAAPLTLSLQVPRAPRPGARALSLAAGAGSAAGHSADARALSLAAAAAAAAHGVEGSLQALSPAQAPAGATSQGPALGAQPPGRGSSKGGEEGQASTGPATEVEAAIGAAGGGGSSQLAPPAAPTSLQAVHSQDLGAAEGSWMAAWLLHAGALMQGFSAPGLASALWALAEAGVQPPGPFMDAALARSLELVAEATPREVTDTLAALARLRYRPPDAWLAAYTAAAEEVLLEFEGEDHGLASWALATLGAPLEPAWLQALSRSAARKWNTHTGESLGLLVWGLAQYGFVPYGQDIAAEETDNSMRLRASPKRTAEWWQGFYRECGAKWEGAGPRGLALMLLGVAELVPTAPDREWQRGLARALKSALPRPSTADQLIPLILAASDLPTLSLSSSVVQMVPSMPAAGGKGKGRSRGTKQGQAGSPGGTWAAASPGSSLPGAGAGSREAQKAAIAAAAAQMRATGIPEHLQPAEAVLKESLWAQAFLAELQRQWALPRAMGWS